MPIELKITAETAAELAEQISALAGINSRMTLPAATPIPEAVAEQAARRTRGPNKPKDDGVALQSTSHPEGEPVAEDADISEGAVETVEIEVPETVTQGGTEVEALTYDGDVKPAILRLSMKKGRESVFKVLNKFGAEKSASEIPEDKWAEVLDAVDEELAEG